MKKKKAVKENWCPLLGGYKYDNIIERARTLWARPGVELRTPEGLILSRGSFTGEAIKKAQAIYDKWDELQRDSLNVERLQCYIGLALNPVTRDREGYLKDILFWFRDLNATELEVFSILAIYEARVSKNQAWPLELLALTEKYSPDAMRGKKVIEGAKAAGYARRLQVKDHYGEVWNEWKVRAEKIWKKNPHLSKLATAKIIYKETGVTGSVSSIRQKIKKPHD